MSRKGNWYDNAAMEAFWSTLKREALEESRTWCPDRVRRELFEYIESIYMASRVGTRPTIARRPCAYTQLDFC